LFARRLLVSADPPVVRAKLNAFLKPFFGLRVGGVGDAPKSFRWGVVRLQLAIPRRIESIAFIMQSQ
jgi:hypothetical protein